MSELGYYDAVFAVLAAGAGLFAVALGLLACVIGLSARLTAHTEWRLSRSIWWVVGGGAGLVTLAAIGVAMAPVLLG